MATIIKKPLSRQDNYARNLNLPKLNMQIKLSRLKITTKLLTKKAKIIK